MKGNFTGFPETILIKVETTEPPAQEITPEDDDDEQNVKKEKKMLNATFV